MAFDYSELVQTANDLISEFGRQIELKQIDKTPDDSSKPWKGSAGKRVSLALTSGVFLPASGSKLGEDWIDDELLKQADKLCLVPGQDADLELADVIIDQSVEWKVQWARVLQPGNDKLLFAFSVVR